MEKLYAKALYDNTAESLDELAFHKGDVVVVMEQNPEGSVGWWKCSLNGQEGLAPANRLRIISPAEVNGLHPSNQNIYQIPKAPQPSEDVSTYEVMERFWKVPSTQVEHAFKGSGSPNMMEHTSSSPNSSIYDIPRRGPVYSTSPQPLIRKVSLVSPSGIQNRYETFESRQQQSNVYAIPSSPSKDPNYDIPMPSINKLTPKLTRSCSTLPNRRKSSWTYDMPVEPEMSRIEPGSDGMLQSANPSCSLYDFPKPSATAQQRTDPVKPECIYDVPATIKRKDSFQAVSALPVQQIVKPGDSESVAEPLEYRGKHKLKPDPPQRPATWGRNRRIQNMGPTSKEKEVVKARGLSVSENQRMSTVSTSSTTSSSSSSSCDSMMFGSPSPELLREITLPQEEVAQRLLELQEAVFKAVPKLMNFVSSSWRSRGHLCQHLQKIRMASDDVANSVTCFLNFALDVRGNAQQLTDSSLQARLLKQLSIVEDSGLILQKTVDDLGRLGWPLDALAQDQGQAAPDQLERFVMMARTVPEDVKHLVSIINANGKLLFRNTPKEAEMSKNTSLSDVRKSIGKIERPANTEGEDDYVQLQTLQEPQKEQQRKAKDDIKLDGNEDEKRKQAKPEPPCPASPSQSPSPSPIQSPSKPQISDHCRLYFGAIKKAIAVFVTSLEEGQPPEKFISHSKLVIMVGQRLIDTLWGEAQKRQDSQDLLCKSNHLCALLKQLAVATKKAAVHYPDKMAICEAQDFAKELYRRAHLFRESLES